MINGFLHCFFYHLHADFCKPFCQIFFSLLWCIWVMENKFYFVLFYHPQPPCPFSSSYDNEIFFMMFIKDNQGMNHREFLCVLYFYFVSIYKPSKPFYFLTSLCTVLLLIPNFLAQFLTVALLLIMYSALSSTLSSIYAFKKTSAKTHFVHFMQRFSCIFNS